MWTTGLAVVGMLPGLAHAEPACDEVRWPAVADVSPATVLVLGERHGAQPDLRRAWRVVRRLARRGRVTVALEAVHEDNQSVLDRYAAGDVRERALPESLRWERTWGFDWAAYRRLVTASKVGARVVAAGLTLGPAPAEAELVIPDGYDALLADAMAGHEMPDDMAARFVRSMVWRDRRIAELAVQGWDGEGVLVIVTGRGHIEGGLGVPFQLVDLTQAPVVSVVLDDADAACLEGDRVWK